MRMPRSVRLIHALRRPLAVAITVLPLLADAQSASAAPSFSGPSTARVAQVSTFNGSGYALNGAVSISVTAPSAAEAHYSSVAGADGTLSYSLTPSAPGMYTLKVLDTSGKVLASLNVYAAP